VEKKKWGNFLHQKNKRPIFVKRPNYTKNPRTLMYYSKIALKLQIKISDFSGYVSSKMDKTLGRFLREAVYGIITSQSVMLTEIGRALPSNVSLKKIEERFCRQLIKPNLSEDIHSNILKHASSFVKQDTLLVLDLGDIHKKYAEEMEYLAKVRDGSSKGEIVNGYWTNQVIATEIDSREVIPLYSELYSQNSPEFKSENNEIIKAINMVSSAVENRGIWVIDRGGDRDILYNNLLSNSNKFIIRIVGNRNLICGKKKQIALFLAESTRTPYQETIVKQKDGKEKVYNISYGFRKVKLTNNPDVQLYMLVVKGFGKKPMMILTTEALRRNFKVLQKILHAYIKRWAIEQTIRFIKQNYGLENIRVLKYVRLKNMMAILLVVFYYITVVLEKNQKLRIMIGHLYSQANRVFGIPNFHYYAIGDGLSAIFNRAPQKMTAVSLEGSQLIMELEHY
jgi:hypothetical protein